MVCLFCEEMYPILHVRVKIPHLISIQCTAISMQIKRVAVRFIRQKVGYKMAESFQLDSDFFHLRVRLKKQHPREPSQFGFLDIKSKSLEPNASNQKLTFLSQDKSNILSIKHRRLKSFTGHTHFTSICDAVLLQYYAASLSQLFCTGALTATDPCRNKAWPLQLTYAHVEMVGSDWKTYSD